MRNWICSQQKQYSINVNRKSTGRRPWILCKAQWWPACVVFPSTGSFLIPYGICLVLAGVPVLILEVALGQFMSSGGITAWNIIPLFQGTWYYSSNLHSDSYDMNISSSKYMSIWRLSVHPTCLPFLVWLSWVLRLVFTSDGSRSRREPYALVKTAQRKQKKKKETFPFLLLLLLSLVKTSL